MRLCQPYELGEDSSSLTLLEAEPLAVSVGIAALKKRGERVSGDRGTYFKTDSGVLCVILADGMGCGDEAAKDSGQVVDILEKSGKKFDYPVKWGIDLQTEHERYLTEEVFKKPIFVTDYPKDIKAFYMRMNDDGKTVAAADCLVPGVGEIIGGSQREERLDVLEARMDELGLKKEDYWWYLDLRRYGSCRHAGYGLGFERMVMYLTGVSNIRDVELHPRTTGSADF